MIHQLNGRTFISEVYEGFPAEKTGLKVGDEILSINEENIYKKANSEVSKMIKGPASTSINISVKRPGTDQPLEFTLNREIIKIENVPYYALLKDDIGYIKLVGFSNNAANEVKNALLDLKKKKGLKGLIIDLRGNGGGLMNEAIDIVNLFVEQNVEVVSTKGKIEELNTVYKTRFSPVDMEIPLAVLINNNSASAAEIVAGALQDLDRAVIVGQRSFGKGLVQNVLRLSYNTRAKITIAKYYIPSGRCIQAIDYSLKDEYGHFTKIPDSLITEYKTKTGRKVYDGGGIDPDIKLKPNIYSQLTTDLYARFFIFDYATKFYHEHKNIASPDKFEITDEIYSDFMNFLKLRNYSYVSEHENTLEELKQESIKDHSFEAIQDAYNSLKMAIEENKTREFAKYGNEIKRILKMEIASRYYYISGKVESSLDDDSEIDAAIHVLINQTEYHTLLEPDQQKALVKK